jgi:hypothetical protein
MIEIAELTKKYGVTGILCAWLSITTIRVGNLETKLEDCWSDRMLEMRNQQRSQQNYIDKAEVYAIIPEKLTIKIKRA